MKQYSFLLLAISCINPAMASIVYTNQVDLNGDDSGKDYNYHHDYIATIPSDVVITATSRHFGFGLIENPNLRNLDYETTKGSSAAGDDIRIDFLYGAKDQVSIGYLVDDFVSEVKVFDENDNLLTTQSFSRAPVYDAENPAFPFGSDQEFLDAYDGQLDIPFSGTAAYMIFDFDVNQESIDGNFEIDNLQMNAAQDQVLERFKGASLRSTAESIVSSTTQQVFDLHVSEDGIGDIAPMFIKSNLLGDYQIDISGDTQLSSIAVIQEYYQTPIYSPFNLNIEGTDYQPFVRDAYYEYRFYGHTPFTTAQVTGLEIMGGSASSGVFHALRFEGQGDVRITLTSLNQISEPKYLFSMGLIMALLLRLKKRNLLNAKN